MDLFEQYGIPLGFESASPAAADLLVEWGRADTPLGLLAAGDGQAAANCAEIAEDVQLRRQALESLGMSAGYLAWGDEGCDWSALALENGFSYGRAELDPPGGTGAAAASLAGRAGRMGSSRMRMADWWFSLPVSR